MRPRRHRPQASPLTPDGTDPTEIRQRLELTGIYVDQPSDGRLLAAEALYEHVLMPRLLLGARASVVAVDDGDNDASGVSDLYARAAWQAYKTEKAGVLVDVEVGIPMSSDDLLSNEQLTVGPASSPPCRCPPSPRASSPPTATAAASLAKMRVPT